MRKNFLLVALCAASGLFSMAGNTLRSRRERLCVWHPRCRRQGG